MLNNTIDPVLMEKIAKVRYNNEGFGYSIDNVGTYVRVSNVLKSVNFDDGMLANWKDKKTREYFEEHIDPDKKYDGSSVLYTFGKAMHAAEDYTNASSIYGNQLHDWLETYLNTGVFPEVPQSQYANAKICADSMAKFLKDAHITKDLSVKPELFTYSKIYQYAGCADWLCYRNGQYILFDWKTSNYFQPKYFCQVAAYWKSLEELYGIKISKAMVINFNKKVVDYTVNTVTEANVNDYFDLFKCCLLAYRFIKKFPITGGFAGLGV